MQPTKSMRERASVLVRLLGSGLLLLGLFACQPAAEQQVASSEADPEAVLQDFPKLTRLETRTLRLDAYTLSLQLTHPASLTPYPNARLPWMANAQYTEASGNLVSYLRNNDPLRLDRPLIRVTYIKKEGQQASIPQLMGWLEETFMKGANGTELHPPRQLTTVGGLAAATKEVYTPQQNGRSQRYLGFAYLDASPDYLAGFSLSAIDSSEYEQLRNAFFTLIESAEP